MPQKFHKYKLLLDEGFPIRKYFPRLNSRFDVKHIVEDLKQAQLPDPKVYKTAVKEKRLVVTFNDKDFETFSGNSKDSGIIGVSANLPLDQIDLKLTSLLNKCKPSDLFGKFHYISGETK